MLGSLGAHTVQVRRPEHLDGLDGLVIPGGESTVIDRLSRVTGLTAPLRRAVAAGVPVFGTCAGLIMLAERLVDAASGQQTVGGLDVAVRRNAFGAQSQSFETLLDVPMLGEKPVPAVFIRAPLIQDVGPGVEVIARLPDGTIVGVRTASVVGLSFHPEMTDDDRFHRHFLSMVEARRTPR